MSDLITVYSPKGEKYEVSSLNAHDLCTHNKWTRGDTPNISKKKKLPDEPDKKAVEDAIEVDASEDEDEVEFNRLLEEEKTEVETPKKRGRPSSQ